MLSQRQRMSPFPNYMSMESVCQTMSKFVGYNLETTKLFFQGNTFYAFNKIDTYEKTGKKIAALVIKNPLLYKQLIKKEEKNGLALINFAKKAGETVGPKTTANTLYKMYAGYEEGYKLVYAAYGSIWVMEDHLQSFLLDIVKKRLSDPVKAGEAINNLTKQPSAMVATQNRLALLALCLKIAKNKNWPNIIKEGNLDKIKADKKLAALIKNHVKKFFWITRDYEDPILDFDKVVEELKKYLSQNYGEEYLSLKKRLEDDEKIRLGLIKELKLTRVEVALFAAMRDAAHLKELRKRYVSESLYYFDPVLAEIGKRLFLSIRQVRFMRTVDVRDALLKNKDFSEELNERLKLSVWEIDKKGAKVTIGKEAEDMFSAFCSVDKNAKEFTGMPVSPGVARGPAKIVLNPDECDKVNKGDIIVSIQVVPSFSTAIIKCAGIICDGGHGITSHPATLAREAKVPCVIQTRFVREVVKDGDMVEVDGYKGVVKIL